MGSRICVFAFAAFLILGLSVYAQENKKVEPASKTAPAVAPAASPAPDKIAKDADEAREILKGYARDQFREELRPPMQKAVNDALGKFVFDYTHEKIWFPVRKEVRDYTCLNFFQMARKMLSEKIGGEKIAKENIASFKEEIGKTITDGLTPDVMQRTREGYEKHMTKEVEQEGVRLAREKARVAAAEFLKTPTVADIKARVHQLVLIKMAKIAGNNIPPRMKTKMPEMVTENAFKNSTENMSENMCETMATTMFQTRKDRMRDSMADHMAGHLLKHINDHIWKKMEEQAGKKFSDLSDAEWQKFAEKVVADLAAETETPEHLKRSYELRWNNYVKERESLSGPRGKNENRGKGGEATPTPNGATKSTGGK